MLELLPRFLRDQSGVTAIEYAMISSLVSIAIVGGVTSIGAKWATMVFTLLGSAFK